MHAIGFARKSRNSPHPLFGIRLALVTNPVDSFMVTVRMSILGKTGIQKAANENQSKYKNAFSFPNKLNNCLIDRIISACNQGWYSVAVRPNWRLNRSQQLNYPAVNV